MTFSKGKRADAILKQYSENPESILQRWEVDRDVTCGDVKVSTYTFFDCLKRLSNKVSWSYREKTCLNNDGMHMLRMRMRDLAASLAKEKEQRRRFNEFDEESYEPEEDYFYVNEREVRDIISTLSLYRIECKNCLSDPTECDKRDPSAPFDEVVKAFESKKKRKTRKKK